MRGICRGNARRKRADGASRGLGKAGPELFFIRRRARRRDLEFRMLGKRGIVPRMSTARTIAMTGATILLASLISAAAFAQQKPLGEHLLGSWMLISHEAARPDGSKAFPYGPSPQGIAIFDASGRFIITVMRSGRSKYAAALPRAP